MDERDYATIPGTPTEFFDMHPNSLGRLPFAFIFHQIEPRGPSGNFLCLYIAMPPRDSVEKLFQD